MRDLDCAVVRHAAGGVPLGSQVKVAVGEEGGGGDVADARRKSEQGEGLAKWRRGGGGGRGGLQLKLLHAQLAAVAGVVPDVPNAEIAGEKWGGGGGVNVAAGHAHQVFR